MKGLANHWGAMGKGEGGAGILVRGKRVGYTRRGRTVLGERSVHSDVGPFAFGCSRSPGVKSQGAPEVSSVAWGEELVGKGCPRRPWAPVPVPPEI